MILGALSAVGGQDYLTRMAEEQPGPFMTLLGKVLPTTLAGEPTAPVITRIELVPVEPRPWLPRPEDDAAIVTPLRALSSR